jgi:elongation factor P
MYSINNLKLGLIVNLAQKPYLILKAHHLKLARGGAIVQTKLKNLASGTILEKNFKGAEKIEPADVEQKKFQFLYSQAGDYFFMDSTTFEQISLGKKQVGETKNFLKEGQAYNIFFFEKNPISIDLPIKIDFKVIKTEPGVKGDTVSRATKKATIETGFTLKVPLFIKENNIIKIDTRTGHYIERSSLDGSRRVR